MLSTSDRRNVSGCEKKLNNYCCCRTAGYIEALAAKIGIPHPGLTSEQSARQIVRSTKLLVSQIQIRCNVSNTEAIFNYNKIQEYDFRPVTGGGGHSS